MVQREFVNPLLTVVLRLIHHLEYLRGTAKSDECEPLFKQYKACLSVCPTASAQASRHKLTRKQKALKERGIDQMLDDARADNKENDLEYLKPSKRPSCK